MVLDCLCVVLVVAEVQGVKDRLFFLIKQNIFFFLKKKEASFFLLLTGKTSCEADRVLQVSFAHVKLIL